VTPSSLKRARDGAEHRHLVGRLPNACGCAALLAHVAQRVLGALAVELVDRHEVGEVEHVDLLELAGAPNSGVITYSESVDERHDRGIALADARGLDDDEVEARALHAAITSGSASPTLGAGRGWPASACRCSGGRSRSCGCGRPAARRRCACARRVDGDDGDASLSSWSSRKRRTSSSVSEDFARAAGAGDAQHRRRSARARLSALADERRRRAAVLERGDDTARASAAVAASSAVELRAGAAAVRSKSERSSMSLIMPCRPIFAVLGRVDARHAVVVQLADLGRARSRRRRRRTP
jgi:hypothetical protein